MDVIISFNLFHGKALKAVIVKKYTGVNTVLNVSLKRD